jgi:hypothetical protein
MDVYRQSGGSVMRGKFRFFIILGCLLVFVPLVLFAEDDKNTVDKYVASKFSIQYHLFTCRKAMRIQERNKVTFKSADEAIKAGRIPCGLCKPPTKD